MGVQKRYLAIAVVCIFLLASFAGCLDNPEIDDDPVREVDIGEPDIYSTDKGGEKVWNIEMVITDQVFEGVDEVSWEEMEIVVFNRFGPDNFFDLLPLQDPIPLDFGAKYVSSDPDSVTVSVGDRIIIHGIGEEYEGGTVELVWDNTVVSEMVLPIQFIPDIAVTFADPVLDSIIFPGSTSYTYEAEVNDIDPGNATLNWWTLQLRIESPTDEFGDFFGPLIEDPGVEGYDGVDGPPDIEFWYIDDPLGGTNGSGTPTGMDVGDSVLITGLSGTFEGGIVTLLKGEDPIWTSDPIPEMPEPDMVLEFGSPTIHTINRNDIALWNISIPVTDVDPEDVMNWGSLWVRVWDAEKDRRLDLELFYDDQGDFTTMRSAWWNDDGAPSVVSKGDQLVIKGLNLSYQGGLVEVYRQFTLLDSIRLPVKWPVPAFGIHTYNATIIKRSEDGRVYFDARINISNITPMNVPIPWADIEARVVDNDMNMSLIPLTFLDEFDGNVPDMPDIIYYEAPNPDEGESFGYIYAACIYSHFIDTWFEVYLNGSILCRVQLESPFIPDPIEMVLSIMSVNLHEFANHSEYRIILKIEKITPVDEKVTWTNITIEVEDSTGAILVAESLALEDPEVYDEDPSDGIVVGLWFIDWSSDQHIGAGDSFKLTGVTKDAEGGTVSIFSEGVLIGTIDLPTAFP